MKKWLLLFVVVDFIFVGLVLKLSTQSGRQIASLQSGDSEMTSGQQQKYDLVQSLQFQSDTEQLVLKTDKLQMICDSFTLIEVKYVAVNVAYAGVQPTISHTFSCAEIKKDLSTDQLQTSLENFKSMKEHKQLSLPSSSMTATQVFSDEKFPADWKLSEITVTGASSFTINQFEIEKIHAAPAFEFTVTSVK